MRLIALNSEVVSGGLEHHYDVQPPKMPMCCDNKNLNIIETDLGSMSFLSTRAIFSLYLGAEICKETWIHFLVKAFSTNLFYSCLDCMGLDWCHHKIRQYVPISCLFKSNACHPGLFFTGNPPCQRKDFCALGVLLFYSYLTSDSLLVLLPRGRFFDYDHTYISISM